jgi:hypothetical protein
LEISDVMSIRWLCIPTNALLHQHHPIDQQNQKIEISAPAAEISYCASPAHPA